MPFKARKAVFEKLEEIADVASLSEEEHELYWKSINAYRTHLCVLEASKEEGREEGRIEGREEGRKEAELAIARSLKQRGIPVEVIADTTGLTSEEIASL